MVLLEKCKWTAIFLTPFWFWLAAYLLVAPSSELGRAIMVGGGIYLFGLFQLLCIGVLIAIIFPEIDKDAARKQKQRLAAPKSEK